MADPILALLVGIDRYAHPDVPSLSGCLNDVADVSGLLTRRFAFPAESVLTLCDDRATAGAIRTGMDRLFAGAADGRPRVLYFGCHGSVAPDLDHDEGPSDHFDEVICPHDFDPARPAETGIVDDEIHDRLRRLPPSAVLTALFDCCHSGTMTRGRIPGRRRYCPAATGRLRSTGEVFPKRPHPMGLADVKADVVAVYACLATQEAQEIVDPEGNHRGAFTSALTGTQWADPLPACRVAVELVDDRFTLLRISQSPVVESSRGRRVGGLFAVRTRSPRVPLTESRS